jgi:hypothetical protein
VVRNWHSRDDAVTLANSLMGSCGWFVPNCPQLQNPGFSCRTYWDSYSPSYYWSSTESTNFHAWRVHFNIGSTLHHPKGYTGCVRAFRCTPT